MCDTQKNKIVSKSQKNFKPEEQMLVTLDSNLISRKWSANIISGLQEANLTYKVSEQLVPDIVTFERKTDVAEIPTDIFMKADNYVLLIMDCEKIVDLVSREQLFHHVEQIQLVYPNRRLCLGLYGLDDYFKYQKHKKRNDVRNLAMKEDKSKFKINKSYESLPRILPSKLEDALMELQLMAGVVHRTLDTPHDLSLMIVQYTKAIGQAPFKLEKNKCTEKVGCFLKNDCRDSVRVDKDGNGLSRLWAQQLTQFKLASLETAEAIATKYPSPSSLIQAYKQCDTFEDAQLLLQDIPIRRAAGPLTTHRKIGPELSRKVHRFFTSTNGDDVIDDGNDI